MNEVTNAVSSATQAPQWVQQITQWKQLLIQETSEADSNATNATSRCSKSYKINELTNAVSMRLTPRWVDKCNRERISERSRMQLALWVRPKCNRERNIRSSLGCNSPQWVSRCTGNAFKGNPILDAFEEPLWRDERKQIRQLLSFK